MGILEDLFSRSTNGGASVPPGTPPIAPAPPSPATSYADFYKQMLAAANAEGRAHPTSLFNWLSGRGTTAEIEKAKLMAPQAFQQQQTGQVGVQDAQLGSAQKFATTGALAGTQIDPSNPMASLPALTAAYGGALNGTPQAAPAGPAAPGGTAPGPQPAAPVAAPIDPVQAQRAFLQRMARFSTIQGNPTAAVDFFKQANAGVPADTIVRPDGAVGDGVTGLPVTTGVGKLLADRAGGVAGAEANAKLPALLAGQTHQGNVDVGVHSANANTDSAHKIVNGIDTTTGKPVATTEADLLHGGLRNFANSNPYFDGQQAEIKELRTKNESADQGLNLGSQIVNAANGVLTGKGADALQGARKWAQTAANLTGAKLDPSIDNDTSKFEQLKFASQQLVAVASHDLSPRVAMNIYNQIAAVKPGDQTSVKGLRDIIINELIPVFQRNKALFGATTDYYKNHPMTNDAARNVPDSLPLANFGVKDVHSAKPGDYFLDPQSGNLRQRPK